MTARTAADEDAATELLLYLDNEEPLYRQKKAIAANLLKKMKKGTYDHSKAPQAWSYVVEEAATRRVVAKALADRYQANVKNGFEDEM